MVKLLAGAIMRSILTLVIIFTNLLVIGCNTGPKLKNKSAYLDSESYDSFALTGGAPAVKTKNRKSLIEGSVQSKGLSGLPLRDVRVVLRDKNKKVLKEIKTDSSGNYSFQENLEDGEYTLEFDYKTNIQKRMVPLKGYKKKVLKVYFD